MLRHLPLSAVLQSKEHSFLQNTEFWAKPWNLFISTKLLHFTEFCRIWYGIFWSGSSSHRKEKYY